MSILERIPGERYSRVLPLWTGLTVVLIAGGPSLTMEQVHQVRVARELDRVRVIGVNDAFLVAPWIDISYFSDAKWGKWMTDGIDKPKLGLKADEVRLRWRTYCGQKCSIQNSMSGITDPAVHIMRNHHFPIHGVGLSRDPGALVTGRHGGFQALNIAILSGAETVLLLGYDAKDGPNGEKHYHGDHPSQSSPDIYPHMRAAFSLAEKDIKATGVRVINCSLESAIDTFPKMALEQALAEVGA